MKTWYNDLQKSNLTPPSWVFQVVWPFLYLTLLISSINIYFDNDCKNFCFPLKIFILHMFLNLIWTTIFFKYKNFLLGLFDLILMLITLIYIFISFLKINKFSGYILIPYIIWLLFATYLTLVIIIKN